MKVNYPTTERLDRSLSGVVKIKNDPKSNYDTIQIGNKVVGFVMETHAGDGYKFVPYDKVDDPYTDRSTYAEALLDSFTEIANSADLAIEFTIMVTRKVNK